jgi:hypothetical protein
MGGMCQSAYLYACDALWDGCYDIQLYSDSGCSTGAGYASGIAHRTASSCAGDIGSGGYYIFSYFCSDRRLKKNIVTLENSLKNLLQIDTVEFDWNEKLTDGKYRDFNGLKKIHSVGLIAQNVKNFYPTIVKTSQQGYYYIEYIKLNAVLVEGIKEQQVFIDDIENQIKELESKFI